MSGQIRVTDDFDEIERPAHYAFAVSPADAIEAWSLNFALGNCVKYIARAAHKGRPLTDLLKARWYLNREVRRLERQLQELDPEPDQEPRQMQTPEEEDDVCAACSGTGVSRTSYRPDDYGPHRVCSVCSGTGQATSN